MFCGIFLDVRHVLECHAKLELDISLLQFRQRFVIPFVSPPSNDFWWFFITLSVLLLHFVHLNVFGLRLFSCIRFIWMKNHQKLCEGGETNGMTKRCLNCNKEIKFQLCMTFQNMPHIQKYTAKHSPARKQSTARIYRSKYICPNCQIQVSATNLVRHRRTCSQGGEKSVPFEEGWKL